MFQILSIRFKAFLFFILSISYVLAQEFQFQPEVSSISVIISGESLAHPFAGGLGLASPAFADIDSDGDFDLFVGEEAGNIDFYLNTGTAGSPAFMLETVNLIEGFDGFRTTPSFSDIDNDGDFDLFVGEYSGNVNFYRNTGTAVNPIFALETENFASVIVINESTPAFIDIDDDKNLDLFVGNGNGNINFYRNTGTATDPAFSLEAENFDSIDVGVSSSINFADIDDDGDFDLFIGEQDGYINFYRNTGTAALPVFSPETDSFASIYVDGKSKPIFTDIDKDGDLDLLVGERDGSLNLYRNTGSSTVAVFTLVTHNLLSRNVLDIGLLSNPTFVDIDKDGDLDLYIGKENGNLNFYRNTGTATLPIFTLEIENLLLNPLQSRCNPTFADIDNDGDDDLFSGAVDGFVWQYRNTGTATNPNFSTDALIVLPSGIGSLSTPALADIDNDGDLDLFVGERDGNINFFRNTGGVSEAVFTLETENFASIDIGLFSTPCFADIDHDGDLDLFIGENAGNINFYRNTGSSVNPVFVLESESFAALDTGYESSPALVDIDNDGDFDLFAGEFDGGLQFYRNVTPVQVFSETKGNPLSFSLSQNYPNPFNSSTTIAFSLARVSLVKLTLFDITGRQVSVLMDGKLDPGEYKLKFEGGELPSGIYICQVQAENDVQSKKILMLK